MRDLIVTENITVDGVIDASAGWFARAGASGAAARSRRCAATGPTGPTSARLFEDATDVPALELVESRPFRSGVVLLRYRVR